MQPGVLFQQPKSSEELVDDEGQAHDEGQVDDEGLFDDVGTNTGASAEMTNSLTSDDDLTSSSEMDLDLLMAWEAELDKGNNVSLPEMQDARGPRPRVRRNQLGSRRSEL